MNKILRFTFVAAMALISSLTFAQNTVTFTAGTDKGADGGNPASDVSLTKDGITLHATNASGNAGVLGRTDNYRFYQNSTLEISSTVGNITKVVFTCTAKNTTQYGPGCFADPSTGSYSYDGTTGTWTGSAPSFTLTASSAQVRATKIEVTYSTSEAGLAAPVISGTNNFSETSTITITAAEGATVYYTTNGQDPDDREGTEYTAPFTINATTTVKAIAYKGGKQSSIAEKTFTKLVTSNAADIAAFNALADNTPAVLTLNNAKVLYSWTTKNGNNSTYIRDASGALCLYNAGLDLNVGQVLNGTVNLTRGNYNGLVQGNHNDQTSKTTFTAKDGDDPVATKITPADAAAHISDLVQLSNVNIVAEGTRFYIVEGDNKVQVYNGFHLDGYTVAAAEGVDVKGIMTVYNGTYEIYPIVAPVATGISEIKADKAALDANAPMYNLAGQRVDKNFKGVVLQKGKKFLNK